MNIKQLMIGDWVFNKHHNKPIQLTAYDYFTHSHKDGVQSFEGILNPHPTVGRDLEPIPLTEEILKANGLPINRYTFFFDEDKDYRLELHWHCGKLYWTINCVEFGITFFDYVHELQHALRLRGFNDIADNFKVK